MSRDNSPVVRVLVVDDEGLIRWSLGQTLSAAGATVVEAPDARTAMAAIEAAPHFDVAVLDMHLPDGNGLALLATIRRLFPSTRVLMMTAHGTAALQDEARALGAAGLVEKPFDLDVMAALVLGPAPAA
jgi:DNA-binding NtrC family response regulator